MINRGLWRYAAARPLQRPPIGRAGWTAWRNLIRRTLAGRTGVGPTREQPDDEPFSRPNDLEETLWRLLQARLHDNYRCHP
jgi:hypothetical protein